jgi:hypothetical protein
MAREAALDAISMAEKYSGRPVLYRAYAILGDALSGLGRTEEGLDAYARAASELDWIRGSLRPEHVDSFMGRPDVRAVVQETLEALDAGGRADVAVGLRKWFSVPVGSTSGS